MNGLNATAWNPPNPLKGFQTENGAITSTYFFNDKGLAYSGENTFGYTDCE